MIPALAVPLLNRPDLLDRLLASIDYPVRDLLIIDNGGVMKWRPRCDMAEKIHMLRMPTNLGVPASWNLAIKLLMPKAPWLMVCNSDAYFPEGSLERFAVEARTDALVLAQAAPSWACFTVGEEVVSTVGLFDEGIHPAYFEDDDYQRRCTFHGFPTVHSSIPVNHDNSSTINSDPVLRRKNDMTFGANAAYYRDKVGRGDMTEGRWSLATRRALSWD
jgi:GT2 family glycosyltransferase